MLWGPPGTGKTHTIKYLISRLQEYTVIEMAGSQLGFIGVAGAIARSLAPAVLVLEDVDLIAEDRAMPGHSPRRLLFDLLDMLDGLDDDADVVSVLTTNRPELLESAIAARPGRIDRAIEVPLPDAEGRRRLIELYGRGLVLRVGSLDEVICRTEGVSPSFIREMLRQAVLRAPRTGGPDVVTDVELNAVLDVLLDPGNPLTRMLLGARPDVPAGAHGRPGHT
ncbi:MAG: AAA family ATPase [Acidimicrobiales bacterium]